MRSFPPADKVQGSAPPTMEDRDLVRKLQEGDRAAFRELVRLYGKQVINACYRLLLDKEDAEDLSQEVFIEVFLSIRSFRGDAKLSTWIYRIAVTKCLDELKKRKRKKRITQFGKMIHLDEALHWLTGGVLPDTLLHEEERMKEVREALQTLPDNQMVAFTLSKMDGYGNQEIAEIMNTTTTAVESLVHRAKKKLNEKLRRILTNRD
jgi:RNA polymerase sigma-70 factor, ECF subfamily